MPTEASRRNLQQGFIRWPISNSDNLILRRVEQCRGRAGFIDLLTPLSIATALGQTHIVSDHSQSANMKAYAHNFNNAPQLPDLSLKMHLAKKGPQVTPPAKAIQVET